MWRSAWALAAEIGMKAAIQQRDVTPPSYRAIRARSPHFGGDRQRHSRTIRSTTGINVWYESPKKSETTSESRGRTSPASFSMLGRASAQRGGCCVAPSSRFHRGRRPMWIRATPSRRSRPHGSRRTPRSRAWCRARPRGRCTTSMVRRRRRVLNDDERLVWCYIRSSTSA